MKESNKGNKKCRHCYYWEFVNWHKGDEGRCTYPFKECPRKEEDK